MLMNLMPQRQENRQWKRLILIGLIFVNSPEFWQQLRIAPGVLWPLKWPFAAIEYVALSDQG
jgi:hypothetical protein